MDEDLREIEEVKKKCVELDSELDTFFQSLKEIKEIRDFVGSLPDKLRQDREEIENRKTEAERLVSSAGNLLITFEEQAKGLLFDMQKKTEDLTVHVRSSMSEFRDVFESSTSSLNDAQRERLEQITGAYQEIKDFFQNIKSVIDSHENSIVKLNENHANLLLMLEKTELSIKGIQNNIYVSQRRPNETDDKIKAMERYLKEHFFTKLEEQKKVIMVMLTVLLIGIIFFVSYIIYSH